MTDDPNDVVGHKTLRRDDGSLYHEPLRRSEAAKILEHCKREDERRRAAMPDEKSAIVTFFDAWLRLKELGWKEAMYCPKDGSEFVVIEAGSTGKHACIYEGEWPRGTYWIVGDGDMSPSRPVLFKLHQLAGARRLFINSDPPDYEPPAPASPPRPEKWDRNTR